jgi:hypothetical protein
MENIQASKRSGRALRACKLDMLVSRQCDGQMSHTLAVVCVLMERIYILFDNESGRWQLAHLPRLREVAA